MIETLIFDEVHDCQEAFRLLLKALSNPGEIVDIGTIMRKMEEDKPELFLLAATLMDKESKFSVVGDEKLAEKMKHYTYAAISDIEEADFLFAPESCSDNMMSEIIGKVKPGTLIEPHTNCVLVIGIDGIPKEETCKIYGPGVDGVRGVRIPDYAVKWIRQRDEMEFEYPTGLDLYFVTDKGELLALPRKVKMEGR